MSFVPVESETDTEYPGYEFRYASLSERGFCSRTSEHDEIVEVYGNFRVVTENNRPFWKSDTIAILRGDDVTLWRRLQLRDKYRNHPSLGMLRLLVFLGSVLMLTVTQSVLAYWFLGPFNFWPMAGVVLLTLIASFFESLVIPQIFALLRLLKLRVAIWRWTFTNKKTNAYYRDLLSRLSKAEDKDKAWAAGLLLRYLF